MKQMGGILCAAVILCIIITLLSGVGGFPVVNDTLVAEKYNGWSGVLRVWICGTWVEENPGIVSWLNRCGSRFEKSNEGIYIHVQEVDKSTAAGICENGIIPPDILIFPPNVIGTPRHLIPVDENSAVRRSLSTGGTYGGITYAQPIIIGGYAWAYNAELIDGIPGTWEDAGIAVAVPTDSEDMKWSAALMSLCSGRYVADTEMLPAEQPSIDLDLGLYAPEPTPSPVNTPQPAAADLMYCALSADIAFSGTAYSDFISGKIAAVPVSQFDIARLQARSDQGKGPQWKIASAGDAAFTDQALYAGIVDKDADTEKTAVCARFIAHLLSGECQEDTCRAGGFSVTDVDSGYGTLDPRTIIENALRSKPVCLSPAFDTGSAGEIDRIVREFISKGCFTPELHGSLLSLPR